MMWVGEWTWDNGIISPMCMPFVLTAHLSPHRPEAASGAVTLKCWTYARNVSVPRTQNTRHNCTTKWPSIIGVSESSRWWKPDILLKPFKGVKTRSPQILLGGPGGQGTRVEVSPDTSRAWATTEVNPRAYRQSPECRKVVQSFRSISGARTNPWRPGIVQGVLASSPGRTWLSPLVRVQDLLGAGGGPKGTDRVRPENKMDFRA